MGGGNVGDIEVGGCMSRPKLESRAAKLRDDENWESKWRVGRTDMQSYCGDTGLPQHYAYGPNGESVRFFDDESSSALAKAVVYAETQNKVIKDGEIS